MSQHPADRLIRELIRTGRAATPGEVGHIVERMATVPFNPESVNVPRRYRALSYLNRTLGRREEASLLHVAQRVSVDAQWATLDIHRRTRAFAQALELNLLPT